MEDIQSRAQQIYVDNLGSVFYMARNGVLEEYRDCQVTPEQESIWRQELVLQMSISLERDTLRRLASLASIARYHSDSIIIEAMVLYIMNNLDKMDSYVRLVVANQIWELAGAASRDMPEGAYSQARNMAVRIWQNIVNNPIVIGPDSLGELNEENVSREEYIKQSAQKCLDKAL